MGLGLGLGSGFGVGVRHREKLGAHRLGLGLVTAQHGAIPARGVEEDSPGG